MKNYYRMEVLNSLFGKEAKNVYTTDEVSTITYRKFPTAIDFEIRENYLSILVFSMRTFEKAKLLDGITIYGNYEKLFKV